MPLKDLRPKQRNGLAMAVSGLVLSLSKDRVIGSVPPNNNLTLAFLHLAPGVVGPLVMIFGVYRLITRTRGERG